MRLIGFSSGALAYADFRRGVAMLHGKEDIRAVELSALRQAELYPMLDSIADLDLSQFDYIAIHAPAEFATADEENIVARLQEMTYRREWPIILHPDAIHDFSLWKKLGESICLENMDRRKPIGRTVSEMTALFDKLPDASFCFDIGHARQVDSTMTESYLMLKQFGHRLRQVHVSEVNTRSKHDPLSLASILAFQEVANLIPEDVPLIIETPIPEHQIAHEIARVKQALPPPQSVNAAQFAIA